MRLILAACIVLLLVALLRWWLPDERRDHSLPSLPDTRFNYTLTDFTARFTNEQGELELVVSGPRLVHDASNRTASLQEPRFVWPLSSPPWTGQAALAVFERDHGVLVLDGDVRLQQSAADGHWLIQTERLQHDRAARTIVGDEPLTLSGPGTRLQAGGLLFHLDDDIIYLSRHIHGQVTTTSP